LVFSFNLGRFTASFRVGALIAGEARRRRERAGHYMGRAREGQSPSRPARASVTTGPRTRPTGGQ
jgi:hypothetical protein